jgi:hypothetical protein
VKGNAPQTPQKQNKHEKCHPILHSFSKTRLEFLVKEKVPESGDQSSPELRMPSKSEDDPNMEEQNSKNISYKSISHTFPLNN